MGKLVTIIAYRTDTGKVYAGIPNGNDLKGNRKLKEGILIQAKDLAGLTKRGYDADIIDKYKNSAREDKVVPLSGIVNSRNLTVLLE